MSNETRAGERRVRLSRPQADLLAELAEGGGLYIARYKRYARTAEALASKGLAEIDEPDNSRLRQDHYIVTDAGKEWLNGC